MSEREEMLAQFTDVTGSSTERAEFYLESSNWTLQLALSSFFESENDQIAANIEPGLISEPMDEDIVVESRQVASASGATKKSKPKAKPKPRFATLASLNKDSSDEEDDEKGQAFYAGGSEHSGNIILGPPKKNPSKDYARELFETARAGNMERFDDSSSESSENFGGTGHRLGNTAGTSTNTNPPPVAEKKKAECDTVTVYVWRQGFTVDDGELRRYDVPRNREFFECITRGQIPPELQISRSTVIRVSVEDHLHEDYAPAAPVFKAFVGSGHTLGNPAPSTIDEVAAAAVSSSGIAMHTADDEAAADTELAVDSTQPTTMIQIRLSDGTRLSARFNHSHNISDIRRYIQTARPQYAYQNFTLLTSFPSKPLLDETETIEKAKLQNAALLQRIN